MTMNWKRLQSAKQHQFAEVPKADIPRSSFNRSSRYKTTFDAGYLIPVFWDEVLPGDTFNLSMSCFARLSTPIVPFMDNMYLDYQFFFVPNRLVWNNWHKFMGAQDNPGDSVSYTIPTVPTPTAANGGIAVGHLYDYFGLPTGALNTNGYSFNNFAGRAYNLVWNEWYRDQNLQNSVVVDKDDGPDTYTDYNLLKRGKRHDYFTSCLPFAQKGTALSIPLGTTAPVLGIGKYNQTWSTTDVTVYESDGTTSVYDVQRRIQEGGTDTDNNAFYVEATGVGGYPNIRADLSSATAATINQLRQAFQLQKLYERDARGGTRYTEIVKAHFGVTSPDARLQRPEYLGGGSQMINVHPIPQTNATGATGTPQGNLAAMGTVAFGGNGFVKSFTEHGHILGLVSVRADLSYQQGLNKKWSRSTKYDLYWPALAQIGEQAVLQQEIYKSNSGDDTVFGYQERYGEYRYAPSQITGKFRSTYSSPLDMWHLAQKFTSAPTLGDTFIKETPPVDRVVAVNTEPQFLFDALFNLKCARPMPVYGVPGNIDRF